MPNYQRTSARLGTAQDYAILTNGSLPIGWETLTCTVMALDVLMMLFSFPFLSVSKLDYFPTMIGLKIKQYESSGKQGRE